MAPRAQWKGFLKLGEISCAVALYTAASTAERTSFHTVNKATGNRVRREFVDEKTGKPVDKDDQVKGYQTEGDDYIVLEPDEIAAVVPEGNKVLDVEAFIPLAEVDASYFDKPYYIAPSEDASEKAFRLILDGMREKKVAALGEAILFRRVRKLMMRAEDNGIVASTLNFDYQVRSSAQAFKNAPKPKIDKKMLDLAGHIIETMAGKFDPADVTDRYEEAMAELVKAKIEGRAIKPVREKKPAKVVSLMDALEKSAKAAGGAKAKTGVKKALGRKKAA